MSIKLPDFRETRCQGIEATAFIEGDDDALLDALEELDPSGPPTLMARELTATYGAKAANRVVVSMGEGEDVCYVRVVAFNRKRLDFVEEENKEVAEKAPLTKLQSWIDILLGAEVEVELSAYFPLPLQLFEDQCSLASVFYNLKRDDMAFRSRQMTLELDEGLIDRLGWTLLDDNENIVVRVDAALAGEVDEDFLIRFIDFFDGFFRAVLMGEEQPEQAKGQKPGPRSK